MTHPRPTDYSQQNPYASSAHNKLLELSQNIGWPKHYKDDLYHHDWTLLRDAPLPLTRFIWGVRESGTDLFLYAPETTCPTHTLIAGESHTEDCWVPINQHNDWLVANLIETGGSGKVFYYLSYDILSKRWHASALPHDLPKCLEFYRTLAQKPPK